MTHNQPRTYPSVWRIFLAIILLAACVWFIWGNSMLSKEASSLRSEQVARVIGQFLSSIFGMQSVLVRFFTTHVRKIAHAVEFAVLGATSVLMLCVLGWLRGHTVFHAAFFVMAVAVVDETIQSFTGRGSSVIDVVLDFAGGVGGIVLMLLVVAFFRAITAAFRR